MFKISISRSLVTISVTIQVNNRIATEITDRKRSYEIFEFVLLVNLAFNRNQGHLEEVWR